MKTITLVVLCAVVFSGCVGVKRYNKAVAENYDLGVAMGKLEESIECYGEIVKIQKRHDKEMNDLMFPELNSFSIDTSTSVIRKRSFK